jgi:hypothetical protein
LAACDFQLFDEQPLASQQHHDHPEYSTAFEGFLHCTLPFSGLRFDRVTISATSAENLQTLSVCGIPFYHLLYRIVIKQHPSRILGDPAHSFFRFPRSKAEWENAR